MSWSKKPYFWAGIAVRVLVAPFLFQWFHPDERQMLEFAHFQAHGRLHPFLESKLHLRNQTYPWLESGLIRLCDSLGLHNPWAYLTLSHLVVSILSWLSLCALVEYFAQSNPKSGVAANRLGWVSALFWIFPWIYSRQLSEAVSFIPTVWLFLSVRKREFARAGFFAGLTTILRYPSGLWAAGAFLLFLSQEDSRKKWKPWVVGLVGFSVAIGLGGLADLHTYGRFMDSAPAYWGFNKPHGPVEQMFGNDGLDTYAHWFGFILTPWLGPIFILVALFALSVSNPLFLFTLPYIAGHIWTPHREPRFMLPLTPFLILAIAELAILPTMKARYAQFRLKSPAIAEALGIVLWIHVGFNFLWYPFNAWAQWKSAQGVLTRSYSELAKSPTRFITLTDPVIDAQMPENTRWADALCQWHRPSIENEVNTRVWILSETSPPGCSRTDENTVPDFNSKMLQRLLRIRVAHLWQCENATLLKVCPNGLRDAATGEPLKDHHL